MCELIMNCQKVLFQEPDTTGSAPPHLLECRIIRCVFRHLSRVWYLEYPPSGRVNVFRFSHVTRVSVNLSFIRQCGTHRLFSSRDESEYSGYCRRRQRRVYLAGSVPCLHRVSACAASPLRTHFNGVYGAINHDTKHQDHGVASESRRWGQCLWVLRGINWDWWTDSWGVIIRVPVDSTNVYFCVWSYFLPRRHDPGADPFAEWLSPAQVLCILPISFSGSDHGCSVKSPIGCTHEFHGVSPVHPFRDWWRGIQTLCGKCHPSPELSTSIVVEEGQSTARSTFCPLYLQRCEDKIRSAGSSTIEHVSKIA